MSDEDPIRRFRTALGAICGADAALFEDVGTTVIGEPARRGTASASAYRVGRHTLIRCDPAVVERVRSLAGEGRGIVTDLDRFEALLGPDADTMHGRGLVHLMEDRGAVRVGGPAADVRTLDRVADRGLIADLVAADEEGAEDAEIDLDDLDERIVGIVRDRALVAYASECPWDTDAVFADIGVLTHPDHRGQRLGHAVVAEVTRSIDAAGRIPMYRCNVENAASAALCRAVGYTEVATLAAISLRPARGR